MLSQANLQRCSCRKRTARQTLWFWFGIFFFFLFVSLPFHLYFTCRIVINAAAANARPHLPRRSRFASDAAPPLVRSADSVLGDGGATKNSKKSPLSVFPKAKLATAAVGKSAIKAYCRQRTQERSAMYCTLRYYNAA